MDIQKTPPKTLEEVGTHLFYMARDLSEIKNTLKDAPTRKEMDDVKLKILTLEREIETLKRGVNKEFVSKNEFKIGLTTITVILSIVVAIVTIWSNIKG